MVLIRKDYILNKICLHIYICHVEVTPVDEVVTSSKHINKSDINEIFLLNSNILSFEGAL